ncbi:hypothetical protein F4556_001530 [Kitasatospora gansuensis]|uniref:Bulb-type lectin domain-containing protein n=1 Tax=Kitasatospora gansuensis TaxID=258050 RepID=A0A7W7S8S7_9ACTN|nr:hypothetical protein [Kitasatospora gansuensis]MBB4945995.1 hypothetical protein [Kitasatospora gansuensis]
MITSKSGRSTARRRLLRTAIVGTAIAGAIGLTATTASATAYVASFTLAQADWTAGDSVGADNGMSQLVLQSDGNLVLYKFTGADSYPVWASGTRGDGVVRVDWSRSGYVKLLNSSGGIVCTMGALNPAPGGHAELRNDGNLVFLNSSGNATWSTGTSSGTGNLNYCWT